MKERPLTLHERISARGKEALMRTCPHRHTQISWEATHFRGRHGSGSGYFEIGAFDTIATCITCNHKEALAHAGLPLCEACRQPMDRINVSQTEREKFLKKEKRDWKRHSLREEHIEAEEERRQALNPPTPDTNVPAWFHDMSRSSGNMFRISQGFSRRHVFPYQCTNTNCRRHGKVKFLHTPGD